MDKNAKQWRKKLVTWWLHIHNVAKNAELLEKVFHQIIPLTFPSDKKLWETEQTWFIFLSRMNVAVVTSCKYHRINRYIYLPTKYFWMIEASSCWYDPRPTPRSRNKDFLICYKVMKCWGMLDNIYIDLVYVTNGDTGEGDLLQAGAGRVNGDVNLAADKVLGDDAHGTNCHN